MAPPPSCGARAPVADDVIPGTRFGFAAVEFLFNGATGKMTGLQGTKIVAVPFADALVQKTVDWPDQELKDAGAYF